jgi:hypothetical protein
MEISFIVAEPSYLEIRCYFQVTGAKWLLLMTHAEITNEVCLTTLSLMNPDQEFRNLHEYK